MRKSAVIGLTSAALAALAPLVSSLAPAVILVQQAERIPEPLLLSILGPATRQLVLVGDSQRPLAAGARPPRRHPPSLFGRLILAGVDRYNLLQQRRMSPAVARLLSPFYPSMTPPSSGSPRPRGVGPPVFFLTHDRPEAVEPQTRSRCNPHEASFVAALVAHLLRIGVEAINVAVLTPYVGQQVRRPPGAPQPRT